MLITEQTLKEYERYLGSTPCPADFDAFWAKRVEEAQAVALDYRLEPAEIPNYDTCSFWNLWFRGIRGEWLYAKYLMPRHDAPVPLVLQFHGYQGSGRSWLEQASYAGMGCALIALDCPGQGGYGQDVGGYEGTTVSGHIISGLDGDPKDLYYVRLAQNICILTRIVRCLEGIDLSRVYINGGSQGGALGLICAALDPTLPRKASIAYPFLSDYRKVCQLGLDEVAYEELRYYARWFDPDGSRQDEIFTKLGYIDVQNFAHLVRCEVLFATALSDTVCPPITQFAVYNKLNCPKRHLFYPEYGHEEIQAFDDAIIGFYGRE